MKKSLFIAAVLGTVLLFSLTNTHWAASEDKINEHKSGDGLVVHEWGVIQLDKNGRAKIQAGVPAFVHKPIYPAVIKRAKPILFFYSDRDIKLDLSIKLKGISFSRWYPAPDQEPTMGKLTELTWENLHIFPKGNETAFPEVDKDHWWAACRKTKAAVLKSGKEKEQFLFYETNDNGGWKVRARVVDGKVLVRNDSKHTVYDLILFHDGKAPSVYSLKSLKGNSDASMLLVEGGETQASIKKLLRSSLQRAGIYDKEIAAFIATWKKELISAEGSRLLYRISDSKWEESVSMNFSVKPKSLKRAIILSRDLDME